MKKIFAVFMIIVIGVMLIPVVSESADSFDITSNTETFTAVNDVTTAEDVVLLEEPTEIKSVKVNDIALEDTAYTLTGSTLSLAVDASVADDTITVLYDYQMDVGTGQSALIGLLPLVFVLIIVVGAFASFKMKD